MITLTETAAGKVKELLAEEGREDIALRIAVQPGGCSGLRYAMYLDDQVSEKDQLAEQFGVRLVVDKMSVPYLTQATEDFVESLEHSGFTIDNPAAQGGCACGHYFHRPSAEPRLHLRRPPTLARARPTLGADRPSGRSYPCPKPPLPSPPRPRPHAIGLAVIQRSNG